MKVFIFIACVLITAVLSDSDQADQERVRKFFDGYVACKNEVKSDDDLDVLACSMGKINIIDDQEWFMKDKAVQYAQDVVSGKARKEVAGEIASRCIDKGSRVKGNGRQKLKEAMKCGRCIIVLMDPIENVKTDSSNIKRV